MFHIGLAGTPVQNNMRELYGLLNLLNPEQFSSEEDFIDQFGDEKSMTFEQVRAGSHEGINSLDTSDIHQQGPAGG